MTWIAVRRHRMGTSTRRSCIQLPSVIKRRHWKWKKGKASEWESGENRLDGIAYSAFASIQITIKFQQCCVECNKKNFRFENKIKMEKRKEKSIQCLPAPFLFPSGRYFHCTQEEWQGKNRDWTNSKDFVNFGEWKRKLFLAPAFPQTTNVTWGNYIFPLIWITAPTIIIIIILHLGTIAYFLWIIKIAINLRKSLPRTVAS